MNIDTKDLVDMLKLAGIGHAPSQFELPKQDISPELTPYDGQSLAFSQSEPEIYKVEQPAVAQTDTDTISADSCSCKAEDLLVPNEIMDQEECNVCAAAPCCCAELGFIEQESADLHNGYDDVKKVDARDYFPSGEHGTPAKDVGPAGARHGNNPMSTSMRVAETLEDIYKRKYAKYLKEQDDSTRKADFLKRALLGSNPVAKKPESNYRDSEEFKTAKQSAIDWARSNLSDQEIDAMSFTDLFLKLVELKLAPKAAYADSAATWLKANNKIAKDRMDRITNISGISGSSSSDMVKDYEQQSKRTGGYTGD